MPEEKFFDSEAATVKKRPSSPKTREPPVRFIKVFYIKHEKRLHVILKVILNHGVRGTIPTKNTKLTTHLPYNEIKL